MPKSNSDIYLKALKKIRAPAVAEAVGYIAAGRFDDAEKAVKSVDPSIYGEVELGKLFTARLQALVAIGRPKNDPETLEVFRRALHWKQNAYPEPHTAIEADTYSAGRSSDRADLVEILGFDPE